MSGAPMTAIPDGYVLDAKGRLVPKGLVKPIDLARNDLVPRHRGGVMAPRASMKTASLTYSERARLITIATKLGLKQAAKALRVGSATLDDAMNGDPLATETRNRLITSLAAVETDLENGHGV